MYRVKVLSTVFVILMVGHMTSITCFQVQENNWKKIETAKPGEYFRLDVIGDSWMSRSVIGCIVKCYKRVGSRCYAVTFDAVSGTCTPGGWVIKKTHVQTEAPPGDIYISDKGNVCDETLGFSMVISESTSTYFCVLVPAQSASFDTAELICENQYGGRLYTPKTLEKLQILTDIIPFVAHYVIHWVGLGPRGSNGIDFYWSDGERFDSADPLWTKLWDVDSDQPNGDLGETCACTYAPVYKLHDYGCEQGRQFICETSLGG